MGLDAELAHQRCAGVAGCARRLTWRRTGTGHPWSIFEALPLLPAEPVFYRTLRLSLSLAHFVRSFHNRCSALRARGS